VARGLLILLSLIALVAAGCGGDDDDSGGGGNGGGGGTDTTAETPAKEKQGECRDVPQPNPKQDGGQKKPRAKLDPAKTYTVEVKTSCGDFTIKLDQKTSPNTAASFVALAKSGFYDNTVFHRIVPGFVIQGGDPTGTGSGGPGYSTRDVPPSNAAYTRGVVAMAKTEAEPPGTAGSQFYVVTGADAGLPPDYALLGKVTDGLDVVALIDEQGDPASGGNGVPLKTVLVEGMKVDER
jgi:cyclophilin family peptidyl-prolyl cis-trans isomerase